METSTPSDSAAMNPAPSREHEWLRQFLGDWIVESFSEQPEGEPSGWTERGRPVGDLWIMLEGEGMMPGDQPGHTVMTLGFDADRELFVGTFIGSMMTHLWTYEGELDSSGTVLTLRTVGPDFEGRMTDYEDIHELAGDGRRVLRSRMRTADGSWKEIMAAHYRRA